MAVGMALGGAATAYATPVDNYKTCKANRGKGSGYECCLNTYGTPIIDKSGVYLACSFKGTQMSPS